MFVGFFSIIGFWAHAADLFVPAAASSSDGALTGGTRETAGAHRPP